MMPKIARRASRLLPLVLLSLLPACAEEETPFVRDSVLNVPEDYATPQLAATAARDGDTIVLRYREAAWGGDIDLPAGVSLVGHLDNPLLPRIAGRVTVNGGDDGVRVERLRISNDAGSGLRLVGSAARVEELWIHDCDGPGIELIGDSPAYIVACDLERCARGILIRDTTLGGHYDDPEHPAAKFTDCNFLESGPLDGPGDQDLGVANLVFQNIPVLYTVYVDQNHWGEGIVGVTAIDGTILDNKDESALRGLADTTHENFISWPDPIAHWWQE